MVSRIIKLLFPEKCLICGGVTLEDIPLCANCIDKFFGLFYEDCPACGQPRDDCACGGSGGEFLFYYSSPASKACIARVKRSLTKEAAAFMAELVCGSLSGRKSFDLVAYPPRSKKNVSKYGFDQAKEIAEHIAKNLGIKTTSAIKRRKGKTEQKLLSASQRRKNALGLFYADEKELGGVSSVLLFDDIYTTGATIKACEASLRRAGVKQVKTFTLAYTPRKIKRRNKNKKAVPGGAKMTGRVFRYRPGN